LKIEEFGLIEVEKLFEDISVFFCKLAEVWKLCFIFYWIMGFGYSFKSIKEVYLFFGGDSIFIGILSSISRRFWLFVFVTTGI